MSGASSSPGDGNSINSKEQQGQQHPSISSHVNPKAISRRPSLLRYHSSNNAINTIVNAVGGSGHHTNYLVKGGMPSNGSGTSLNPPVSSPGTSSNNSPTLLTTGGNVSSGGVPTVSNQIVHPAQVGRNRSRSLTQMLAHNLQHGTSSNTYIPHEKAYIKKLRNQVIDDYYTKGIIGADEDPKATEAIDDDDDELDSSENGDLLADIDDDKYQIDFSLAMSLSNETGNSSFNPGSYISQITNNNTDDPAVMERLEWQSMLTSVLTGDVVKSEKTKIINTNSIGNQQESFFHATYKENLWYGIRAKLCNRTEEDQRKLTSYRRSLVDQLIDDIMSFEVEYNDLANNPPRNQVVQILERYERACDQWRTFEEMKNDKPASRSEEFQNRIDALNSWLTLTDAIAREIKSLKVWIGNDELDISRSPDIGEKLDFNDSPLGNENEVQKIFDEDKKSMAEQLMKEKDVKMIFDKRVFFPLTPWMVKSKNAYIKLGTIFEDLKLPDYIHELSKICITPMNLIKEIINIRLVYAMKLQNPTLMMIDQMIDDFQSYISIAIDVKRGILEYCDPGAGEEWIHSDLFDVEFIDFDKVVLKCVQYLLVLLNRKLLDSSRSPTTFRTFKEPEELEETWIYLNQIGKYIDGGRVLVAQSITTLTSKLIQRLLAYFNSQINNPSMVTSSQDLIRWYTSTTENFGQLRRKLARFTGEISTNFTNCFVFDLPGSINKIKSLLEALRRTNHFLVYTGTVEGQGTYFFASGELRNHESEILKIINGSYVGIDSSEPSSNFVELLRFFNNESGGNSLMNRNDQISETAYVVALSTPKPIVWEGYTISLEIENVPITDVKAGQMLVISKTPHYDLSVVRERFLDVVSDVIFGGGMIKPIEQRCSLAKVHTELTKINKVFFKMTLSVLESVNAVKENCKIISPQGGCQELINNYYVYARDFGKNSIKNLDSSRKSTIIMRLINLSISWVSYICDDCTPTDRKTFRWCVLALEFAMDMTRGFNVLVLEDEKFYRLKLKVARCMSLLISHFDIMGARSSEAEKRRILKWSSQRSKIENSADDDQVVIAYREDVLKEIEEIEEHRRDLQTQLNSIGRVLDVSDSEYQFVTLLASSFSSVSIRWQKGKFIGGGTFGNVHVAVNLDTGGLMAVKEIRFHDSHSIKNIVASIKDEMTVLEMLNHPNVVQYFGVEVHRDKVYIFMEFCEGGSLAGLLTHGRIEDEMVIQVYTLQMLEGLAYLHHSGVVHRDIKPDNILLDHNGVIKFVDFGAAKVIATSGRTKVSSLKSEMDDKGVLRTNLKSMTGTPMYMSPEVINGSSTERNYVLDIWSLGCCVLEMATGRRPWTNLDNEWAIMYHIAAGHKPHLPGEDELSEGGRRFLSRCLEHDPKKRSSAAELLNDPWINAIRQSAFDGSDTSTPSSEVGLDM